MPFEALLSAVAHAHAHVPRKALQAKEGAMCGESRDCGRALLPARVQVAVPDVRDIAVEALHRQALPLRVTAEFAGGREALIEKHFVERWMLERPRVSGSCRHECNACDQRQ